MNEMPANKPDEVAPRQSFAILNAIAACYFGNVKTVL